jgi:hypothetical protein
MTDDLVITIEDESGTTSIDPETGAKETRLPDGGVEIDFKDHRRDNEDDGPDTGDKFYRNLADDIDQQKLAQIAEDLIEAIQADDDSRQGYLQTRARGLDLMGLDLKEPKSTVSDGSNPVEGMSSVTNPLLAEAVFKGWANSVGEFLPANGPVKVKDDGDQETAQQDDLAEALERDMNHYLTVGAPEYYPETSYMLLWGTYFGGSGIKKVHRCPLKRRPTSETVKVQDFIVSNDCKDLKTCARITHQIEMRPSVMKRMQFSGAYRKVGLTQPTPTTNVVDEKEAAIEGIQATPDRPEDQPYTVWECQCELDLPEFQKKTKFANEGIPLPYLVTIDKDSREILALRRDWKEEDEECQRRRMYVKYPYIPGPGFYGTGLLNVLGNCSAAMTAAWREALDAGMFASFPGGLMAKGAGRQNTTFFQVAPGEWKPVDTGGMKMSDALMPLPYRDVTGGLLKMMEIVTTQAQRTGGAVDIPTQEGIQNVPVGTMLAHIEQATKVILATHRGMHTAQSEELELIEDLFREHPEDFWRALPRNAKEFWNEQKLLQALDDVSLVPVSDPNTPSHIHRIAKALGLVELSTHPVIGPRLDPDVLTRRVLEAMREDPKGIQIQAPAQQAPPDLKGMAAIQTAQARSKEVEIKAGELQQKAGLEAQKAQDEKEIEGIRLHKEMVIHEGDMRRADQEHHADMQAKAADLHMAQQEHAMERQAHAKFGLAVQTHQHERKMAEETHQHERQMAQQGQEHQQSLAEESQSHGQGLAEDAQKHEQKLAAKYPPQQTKGKE